MELSPSALAISLLAAPGAVVSGDTESLVARLLLQLLAILVATRIVTALARRLGQTDVSGEILAGILLGPSCLGLLSPEAFRRIFDPSTTAAFAALAQIGLIFLVFQIGLEFHFRKALPSSLRTIALLSVLSIAAPFCLGYGTAPWFHENLPEPRPPKPAFELFFATAMSITALPILGRIFMELRIAHTRVAVLTIAAAAVDDVLGWLLLGLVSALASEDVAFAHLGLRVVGLVLFLLLTIGVVRPLLKRLLRIRMERHRSLDGTAIVVIMIAIFSSAIVTSTLGVFAIIGAFLVGVALHDDRELVESWRTRVSPIVNLLFVPIFFTYTGLRTDIGSLSSASMWGMCLAVCGVAFLGKHGGAYLGARLGGENHRDALVIGVCMNTRALMELIVVNAGYDLGLLPREMYTMLVIMAVVSTFVATPLLRFLIRPPPERSADELGGPVMGVPSPGSASPALATVAGGHAVLSHERSERNHHARVR